MTNDSKEVERNLKPTLSRIKIEFNEKPQNKDMIVQSIAEKTNQFETVRQYEQINDTLYVLVEASPGEINLDSLNQTIESILEGEVLTVWVRKVFYDELDALEENGFSAIELMK